MRKISVPGAAFFDEQKLEVVVIVGELEAPAFDVLARKVEPVPGSEVAVDGEERSFHWRRIYGLRDAFVCKKSKKHKE